MLSRKYKYLIECFVIFIFCIISSFFILFTSYASSPLAKLIMGYDSAFFHVIGRGWNNGLIPYKDLFDHKGPLLFLFFKIADSISDGKYGLYIIETLFCCLSLYFTYKISSLFTKRYFVSIFISVFSLIPFSISMGSGNLCEEYSLPFLLLPLYILLKYFLLNGDIYKHNYIHGFIYGFCFSCVIFIRATNFIVISGYILVIVYELCKTKNYINLMLNIIFGVLGMLVVIVPFSVYFISVNAFYDMWYGTILFNFKYTQTTGDIFKNCITSILWIVPSLFCLLTSIVMVVRRNNLKLASANIISSCFSTLFLLSGNMFDHYFLILVPFFALSLSISIHFAYTNKIMILVLILGIIGQISAFSCYIPIINSQYSYYFTNDGDSEFYFASKNISSIIPIEDRSSVLGINVEPRFYLDSNILPEYKYFSNQTALGNIDKKIRSDLYFHLKYDGPTWLLLGQINNDNLYDSELLSIIDASYEEVLYEEKISNGSILYRKMD